MVVLRGTNKIAKRADKVFAQLFVNYGKKMKKSLSARKSIKKGLNLGGRF